jgi:uncharacterized cupredoxin-like copper-binding protein
MSSKSSKPSVIASHKRRLLRVVAMAAALVTFVACRGGGPTTVTVELKEFSIGISESSAEAGEVTFELKNTGQEKHEFVVMRTDLGLLDLPTTPDGSVDEEGSGIEVVDEVEDIPAGQSQRLTVNLDAGSYVLICNIVEEEEGKTESHYQQGMRAQFTVE